MKWFLGFCGGRKFLISIAGVIACVISHNSGISETTILAISGQIIAFVAAQGWADGKSGGATSTTANVETEAERTERILKNRT